IIGNAQALPINALVTGLLSAFGYGLYSIFGRYALNKGYHPLTIAFYTFVFATIGVVFLISPQQYSLIAEFSAKDALVAVLMGIVVTVLPYVFYTIGLSGIESGSAAIMASVEPVVATVVSIFIFKEDITLWGIIGILLVLSSIIILNIKTKKNRA
ncbi:MAG: DMT family transporter, partial [Christensenellaceae bacterium]|nr:DMT family transporter [Christensenellaceae bacterium]